MAVKYINFKARETRRMPKIAGFTLIEVMVTVFGFALISIGLIALVSGLLSGTGKQAGLLADADEARKITFAFANELRRAAPSVVGSYSLEQANSQQIIFYSNIDSDPEPERIRYYISANKLYKGIINPSGNPLTYSGGEQTVSVQQNVANGTAPLFYYYNGNYTGISDSYLTQPVSITAVRYVRMHLIILNKGGVTNNKTYTVSAGAAIRNLKTNLGN